MYCKIEGIVYLNFWQYNIATSAAVDSLWYNFGSFIWHLYNKRHESLFIQVIIECQVFGQTADPDKSVVIKIVDYFGRTVCVSR